MLCKHSLNPCNTPAWKNVSVLQSGNLKHKKSCLTLPMSLQGASDSLNLSISVQLQVWNSLAPASTDSSYYAALQRDMWVARRLLLLALSLEPFCARKCTQNIFTVRFNQDDEHPGLSTRATLFSVWPQQELCNRVLPVSALASASVMCPVTLCAKMLRALSHNCWFALQGKLWERHWKIAST